MAAAIDITVKVNGGIFSKNIPESVRTALKEEALTKITARMMRGGKGLGVRRNFLVAHDTGQLETRISSTRIYPRTRGTAWQRKNIAAGKVMAPRVLKKAADRVVAEMGA